MNSPVTLKVTQDTTQHLTPEKLKAIAVAWNAFLPQIKSSITVKGNKITFCATDNGLTHEKLTQWVREFVKSNSYLKLSFKNVRFKKNKKSQLTASNYKDKIRQAIFDERGEIPLPEKEGFVIKPDDILKLPYGNPSDALEYATGYALKIEEFCTFLQEAARAIENKYQDVHFESMEHAIEYALAEKYEFCRHRNRNEVY